MRLSLDVSAVDVRGVDPTDEERTMRVPGSGRKLWVTTPSNDHKKPPSSPSLL